MDPERTGTAPGDGDLASLLAGYRHVLRCADALAPVQIIRLGAGRWLRHVPVLVTTAFLRPIVTAHARARVLALERALHYEAAATGADRSQALACLEHFRQSLPDIPTRRYLVSFLAGVLVCALVVSNVARALAPAELEQASRAMGDLSSAIVTVNTDALIDGARNFTLGSAVAAAVVVTLSLQVVAMVPLGSFRLKRILFNHHPASAADVAAACSSVERRRSVGLYELEARVFAAHELPEPCERPADLGASASLAVFPLLLGVAVVVTEEPSRALGAADRDVVNYVLLPAALFLLLVLPLAMLNHLAGVRAERRMRGIPARVYAATELAPLYRRALAAAVDVVLALPLVMLGLVVLAAVGVEWIEGSVLVFGMMPLALTAVTVPCMLRDGRRAGQSPGKQLLRVRVVDAKGGRLRANQVLVREALVKSIGLFGLAALLLWIPTVLDAVLPLRDPERRSLEDRVAATRVLRASVPVAQPAPEPERQLVAA
jgi:uncharacterized RDD family membrane protein YckC